MLDIFRYAFMVRALLAGLLVAVTVPLMGSFLVARRYSLIADSLAHVSLAGIGAGLLLGSTPILFAVPVTVVGGLMIEYLRQNKNISGETSLAILMSGGLAVAVVLANLAHGARTDFNSYLFGSIATTERGDIITLAIAALLVIFLIAKNYQAFLHIAFDEDSARIAGYKVSTLNYLLAAMTAVIVVLSLRIVGGLLISALLVIPVVTASRFTRSFAQTIFLASAVAMVAVITGLFLAFYVGIAAGGAIVLSALVLFILSLLLKS
ncbi:MAG TPA: metal ABC transporter permease [Candidatus Saccharimonadales bacterium]|nr:metal ABC transporter permease [Candidatus Saccharimonadales bacterium]